MKIKQATKRTFIVSQVASSEDKAFYMGFTNKTPWSDDLMDIADWAEENNIKYKMVLSSINTVKTCYKMVLYSNNDAALFKLTWG